MATATLQSDLESIEGYRAKPMRNTVPARSTVAAPSRLPGAFAIVLALSLALSIAAPVAAQDPSTEDQGQTILDVPLARPGGDADAKGAGDATAAGAGSDADSNVTEIPRTTAGAPRDGGFGLVRLVALLTADGQRIDEGIVWRVFRDQDQSDTAGKLVSTLREAAPIVRLRPGDYLVNAAFGRAHLTRKISIKAGAAAPAVEQFVLNAGGLRVTALVGGTPAAAQTISYDILSDRDQSDNRKTIMTGAKPGMVIRLNAGIYHIVSTYGDANATVRSDVTVEAGKLSEATLSHTAARVTFKLVAKEGGDALPDTAWTIQTPQGGVVKQSVGALPTHVLAPGTYVAVAKSDGKVFQREFTVIDGAVAEVEVVIQ